MYKYFRNIYNHINLNIYNQMYKYIIKNVMLMYL